MKTVILLLTFLTNGEPTEIYLVVPTNHDNCYAAEQAALNEHYERHLTDSVGGSVAIIGCKDAIR